MTRQRECMPKTLGGVSHSPVTDTPSVPPSDKLENTVDEMEGSEEISDMMFVERTERKTVLK